MKKLMLMLTILVIASTTACSSKNVKINEKIVTDEKVQSHVLAPEENAHDAEVIKEETHYIIKNYDTNEILGYLKADDSLVKKVIKDVTKFYELDCSMKPDTVEKISNKMKKEHRVSDKILTNKAIDDTVAEYKEENRQDDFYDLEINELRFRDDKNAVTVVAKVSYLDTKMNLKINEVEAGFEYNQKYDVWSFCGNYSFNEIQ